MNQVNTSGGFSRLVHIELHVADQCLPVAQMGGGRLIFDQPVKLPGTIGEVLMRIDGFPAGTPVTTRRWRVSLRPSSVPARIVFADFGPVA
jgi:hypothetical protein